MKSDDNIRAVILSGDNVIVIIMTEVMKISVWMTAIL